MSRLTLLRPRSRTPSALECQVVLLDNAEFITTVEGNAEGGILFHDVCDKAEIPLRTRKYFGLQYVNRNDGETNWLDLKAPIHGQINSKTTTKNLQFAVKVFPKDPMRMDPIVQRLIVFQIKDLLSRGKIRLPIHKHALLDSYFAQAILGDYSKTKHTLGYLEDLLGSTFFGHPSAINSNMDVHETTYADSVTMLHKSRKGMSAEEAIMAYLDLCASLPNYGLCLHRGATNDKGSPVVIVISMKGMRIYSKDKFGEPDALLEEHLWDSVHSMTCSKSKFYFSGALKGNTEDSTIHCFKFHGHFGFQNAERIVTDMQNHQGLALELASIAQEKKLNRRSRSQEEVLARSHRFAMSMSAGRARTQNPMASLKKQMRRDNGGHVW